LLELLAHFSPNYAPIWGTSGTLPQIEANTQTDSRDKYMTRAVLWSQLTGATNESKKGGRGAW